MARLIYDNTHSTDVLSTIRQLMWNHGFDGNRVTASVQGLRSTYTAFNCGSVYGDSALVIMHTELIAAIAGTWGLIGQPTNISWMNALPCGGSTTGMIALPVFHSAATATNFHAHICVGGDGFGGGNVFICNPSINATSTAQVFYNDVWSSLVYRGLTGNYVVFGETTSAQNCDDYTVAMAEQNGAGYRASTLYSNHAAATALRPWNNIASSCMAAPSYINNAYYPFM